MPTHFHVVTERIFHSRKNRSGDGKDPGKTHGPSELNSRSAPLTANGNFPEILSDVTAARRAIRRQAGRSETTHIYNGHV